MTIDTYFKHCDYTQLGDNDKKSTSSVENLKLFRSSLGKIAAVPLQEVTQGGELLGRY
jgi:hypothetical protein